MSRWAQKFILSCAFIISLVVFLILFAPQSSKAAFNANRLIDDPIFSNSNSMSADGIDAWLNGWPSSCISTHNGFSSPDPIGYNPSQGFIYGGNVSGGTVIDHSAKAYDINPQVLLATLQKESSVVSGDASYHCQYINTAMGYGCPDSGSCPTNPATMSGFSKQVIHAAWLLKFGQQRSLGNVGWAEIHGSWDNSDDPATCYGGPMTQGNRKRCSSDSNAVFYDGYITIDGASTHMDTGATAALYWYTPHFHGNQNFVSLFESWFGSTISDRCVPENPAQVITDVGFRKFQPHLALGGFIIYSGTSTYCLESHAWDVGFGSWQSHVASNQPAFSPTDAVVKFADLTGNGKDNPILIGFNNTSTNKVEFHVWNYDMKSWIVHAVSNLSTSDAQDVAIEFADLYGSGHKDPVAIKYKNLSNTCPNGITHNCVELHIWDSGLQSWKNHIITNLPGPLNPAQMQIAFGDLNGDGQDEAIAIGVGSTSTTKVEFHVWAPGLWAWQSHIVSNLPTAGLSNCSIYLDDLDTDRIDNGVLVCKQNTSTGKIEFHVWNPGLNTWQGHYVSNQPIL